jgi:hypothetical protein
MYAGVPASFSMVMEEIRVTAIEEPHLLSRRHILETVRRAYLRVFSRLSASSVLNPYGITIEELKEVGANFFGGDFNGELLRRIDGNARSITDQMLITEWGGTPLSAMVYEVGPDGDGLHEAAGFAAIGSGSQMAQTMLVLLGQGRHRTLAETIFNVACAKFSSEKSGDLDVGKWTTICVSSKRTDYDEKKPRGQFCR